MLEIKNFINLKELKEFIIDTEKLIDILRTGITFVVLYFILLLFIYLIFKTAFRLERFQKNRLATIRKTINLILRWIFISSFFVVVLKDLNFNINAILTGAGALGAALVLLFQNSLRDLFTGWLFAFEDVFRQGEDVVINNTYKGKIENLTSRYLILESEDGSIIYLPFSKIDFIQNLSRNQKEIEEIEK
jgi:small-conductance mechanosensitive channel